MTAADQRTDWQRQRDDALEAFSAPHARTANAEFRRIKADQLAAVAAEKCSKRHAIDAMRRKYEKLRTDYLKITGTVYSVWLTHGAQAEWDEVLAAAMDDAVWDRLVERGVVP